jgi:hypothetical protein
MLTTRLAQRLRSQDWFAVAVELGVVVVGILVAFQIDRWREIRENRALEATYIRRLTADIEADVPRASLAIGLAVQRRQFAELLMDVARDPHAATTQPARFLVAIESAAFTFTPAIGTQTIDDLRSTGNLRLIRDESLLRAIHAYYGFDQQQRQWLPLNLASEQHYFELVAGVVDHEQARWIVERFGIGVTPDDEPQLAGMRLDHDGVLAAATRLRERQGAVDWLPQLRAIQIEHEEASRRRHELAESLLAQLRAYGVVAGRTGLSDSGSGAEGANSR